MNFSGLKKRNLWQFFFLITYKYQAQLFGMCIDLKNRQRVKEIETRDRELSWLELILWLLIATLITRLFILALVQYSERLVSARVQRTKSICLSSENSSVIQFIHILFTSLCYTSLNRALYKLIHLSDGVYS